MDWPLDSQFNVDAIRVAQAFAGSSFVQQMVKNQVDDFMARHRSNPAPPVDLAVPSSRSGSWRIGGWLRDRGELAVRKLNRFF